MMGEARALRNRRQGRRSGTKEAGDAPVPAHRDPGLASRSRRGCGYRREILICL